MSRGDPKGVRDARREAAALLDALSLVRLAKRLVEESGEAHISDELHGIAERLGVAQRGRHQRGGGKLEGRRKYRGRSQHLALECDRPITILGLDESGKPDAPVEDTPHFVLAAVAMTTEAVDEYATSVAEVKTSFGLSPDLCLHAADVYKGTHGFEFDEDRERQKAFQDALFDLFTATECTVFAAIIRRKRLSELADDREFARNMPGPVYETSIMLVLERFLDYIAGITPKRAGKLVFESVGSKSDALHQRAYAQLLIHGSEFVSDGCLRGWLLPGCEFIPKKPGHPTEVADFVAGDLRLWANQGFPNDHRARRTWDDKIYRNDDLVRGKFGIKIFPDDDIRPWVEEYRATVAGK